jgi:outer membrane receptor protein involved in Fe transport
VIVVTGQAPAAKSSIDRKTYKVSNNLQSGAGSASDVLRDIPSVDVDAQGAISLRGDTNVQILIDGKLSTTMTNGNRGDALEQFPANSIDHVEVITNPSAQFKPDGSGGIINIVTKKTRRPGLSGAVSASGGSDGRFNLAGNATYRAGDLTATASITLHRDVRRRPFTDRRSEIDPATGAATNSTQDGLFHGEKLSRIVSGGVDYDVTAHDRLSASVSYTLRTGTPQTEQHNVVTDPTSAATTDFQRNGTGHEHEVSDEVSARYRHEFARKGQEFTLDFRRGETIENEVRRFTDTFAVPAGLVTIDQQRPRLDTLQRELTAEYTQPLLAGKLVAGYDLQRDDDDFRNRGDLIDPVTRTATVDPAHTNHFAYGQTIHAFYATFDTPLVKNLSAIMGLRFEQTDISAHQIDLGTIDRQSYFRAYPTLHLQYDVAQRQKLKFNVSKRVVRPDPEDFNPTPEFSDPLNQRVGNPQLKPQETQAFEAGYQFERPGLSAEATLFLRVNRNVFTDISRFITPTVLLTTKENLGRSTVFGVDLASNGKVTKSVSYRISGTLSRNRIDASNLGIAGIRSITGISAKAGLDYKFAPADLIQVSANYNGRRLTPQGYRLPSATANLGYRHKFRSGLSAVLTVSDVFNSQRERGVIETPTLIDRTTRRNTRRIVSLALSMPFGGGGKSVDAPIEYGE